SYEKHQEIPQNQYTKWFDYDRIMNALSLRTRRMGDYMTLKDGKHKTIKSYMIDEKIPKEQRDRIPVLADGNHVLWIIGYRMSEYYKITDATTQVLQVQTDGGKNHGR
ncbi:MAG: tRNA lysidine(34) synthetase TilS, partial [Hungatella sp.]